MKRKTVHNTGFASGWLEICQDSCPYFLMFVLIR